MPHSTKIIIALIVSLLLSNYSALASSKASQITFIVPDSDSGRFWSKVTGLAEATANSLNMDMDVLYADNNRFAVLEKVELVAAREHKPKYVIFRPFKGNAATAFEILNESGIYFVTMERAFVSEELNETISPLKTYEHWLGQIKFDDYQGGMLLIDSLMKTHRNKHANEAINITAFGGDFDSVSKEREQGLVDGIDMQVDQNILLNQIFPTNWRTSLIEESFDLILERYPKTNIFWCASDSLSLAVLDKLNGKNGHKYTIGGFDWMPNALSKIRSGQLSASIGGHFVMGANVLVQLHDFENGIDRFNISDNTKEFELIDQRNIHQYYPFLSKERWRDIDFKHFSAHHTEAPVELNVENMIRIYQQHNSESSH